MIIKDDRTIKEIITNLREKYPDFEWHIIPFQSINRLLCERT